MFTRKKMSENIAPLGMEGGLGKNHAVDGHNKAVLGKMKKAGGVGQVKRSALGDIANANEKVNIDAKCKIPTVVKVKPTTKTTTTAPTKVSTKPSTTAAVATKKKVFTKKDEKKDLPPHPLQRKVRVPPNVVSKKEEIIVDDTGIDLDESLPLDRVEEDISVIEEDDNLCAFDSEHYNDIFHVALYAQDIFNYYKKREIQFHIPAYMINGEHPITPAMRSILVDWMVEIQENFELNHETLYLGVKLTDLYLSRVPITKENLQLVGAVALFVASKFDEQRYPLIEDFTFVCDHAFDSHQFLKMEMDLLKQVDFDLGIPISYRFLRRYAKVGKLSIQTLTLGRYILELSLMEAEFISERDSKLAAAALYLAMKMRKESKWEGDLVKASGYLLSDFKAILIGLNTMLLAPTSSQLKVIRCKYSHIVFHEVAKIPTMKTEKLLS